MLSLFSTVDVADLSASEPSRARIRAGAWLGSGNIPAPKADRLSKAALAFMPEAASACVRPQAHQAYLFSNGTQVAGQAEYVRQQHTSTQKFNHKTRIATQSGGALGSHPARDPV
ncbi:MAG TPA: hypothetical protein VGM14_13950 [Streptosporangiaceae bacterium]|jgi:hypothetical protein